MQCSVHKFLLTLSSLPVGNWRPGEIPTKELLTLISLRIKNQKKKGIIRESNNPGALISARGRANILQGGGSGQI